MTRLAIAVALLLLVVALRRREPVAVTPLRGYPPEDEDGVLPWDGWAA